MFNLFNKNENYERKISELAYLCFASYESMLSTLEGDIRKFRNKSSSKLSGIEINKEALFAFSFVMIGTIYKELSKDKDGEITLGNTLKQLLNEDWWRIKDLNAYQIACQVGIFNNEYIFDSIKNYKKNPKIDMPLINIFLKSALKKRNRLPRVIINRSLQARISVTIFYIYYRILQS